jgi:hypothetical protein
LGGPGDRAAACIPHYKIVPIDGFGPLEIYPPKIMLLGAAVELRLPQWAERKTLVDPDFSPSVSWTNFRYRLPKIDKRNFGITKLKPWRFMERVVWTADRCCQGSFAFRLNVMAHITALESGVV